MAPKRASKQQQQLNVDQFKLLKKPMDHLGKQINVPGSFWQGRMLPEERDKVYKCTIVDFSLVHKFAPDSSPRKAFKMQEMGIDGTGSHEESDLASTMYWIDYPLPFLRFYYDTFPAVDDGLAGAAEVVSLARAGGNGLTVERACSHPVPKGPARCCLHQPYTLVSATWCQEVESGCQRPLNLPCVVSQAVSLSRRRDR